MAEEQSSAFYKALKEIDSGVRDGVNFVTGGVADKVAGALSSMTGIPSGAGDDTSGTIADNIARQKQETATRNVGLTAEQRIVRDATGLAAAGAIAVGAVAAVPEEGAAALVVRATGLFTEVN